MAKTSTLNIRIDPELKESAQAVLAQIGLSTSEAIGLFLRRVSKEKAIPFKVKVPNEVTKKALENSKKGVGVHEFDSMGDLLDDLEK